MRSSSWLIALALAVAVMGCPKKKTDASGEGGAGEAGATANGPPTNTDDITRYPYEKKIDSEAATTARDGVVVHKSPPDGSPVATLPSGANVIKISQTANSFLITFDDPSSGKRMMGWITDDAFSAAVASASATTHWTPPPRRDAGGGGGDPTDAGGGGGGGGGGTADAGGGGGGGGSGPVISPTGGACPGNYSLLDDKMCHMKCSRGPECGNKRCTKGLCR